MKEGDHRWGVESTRQMAGESRQILKKGMKDPCNYSVNVHLDRHCLPLTPSPKSTCLSEIRKTERANEKLLEVKFC